MEKLFSFAIGLCVGAIVVLGFYQEDLAQYQRLQSSALNVLCTEAEIGDWKPTAGIAAKCAAR